MRELAVDNIKVCAVMSLPRVGWNDSWGCVHESLLPFGIPIRRFSGAYWHQCMENSIESCVADGVDWIIAVDYDSMFTKYDVDRLLGHLGNNPDVDAIAAVQCRRGMAFPLCGIKNTTEVQVDMRGLLKVDTAHFGLTVIRAECLADLPKPWFLPKPSDRGDWGDGRIDADIWFWHQWTAAGKTIYVAPDVRIGHLEILVSCFSEKLEPELMSVTEWRRRSQADPKAAMEAEERPLVRDIEPALV